MYERLNVSITERGESFYQKLMKDVVRELDDKGKITAFYCTSLSMSILTGHNKICDHKKTIIP